MLKYIFLMLLGIYSLQGNCQNSDTVKSEILKLEDEVLQGILKADTILLNKLWTPEFMVNTPRNNIALNRAAVYEIQRKGLIDYERFERNIEQVLIQGDIIITMGNELFVSRTNIPGAKAGDVVKRRFTNIWKKTHEGWKQIARHASIICN